LSREELLALGAFTPIMSGVYLEMLVDELKRFGDGLETVLPYLLDDKKQSPELRKLAESKGRSYWAMLHAIVLFAPTAREILDTDAEAPLRFARLFLKLPHYGGLIAGITRSTWAIAKIGRALLPECKRAWEEATTLFDACVAGLAIAAIGKRHAHGEAAAKKILSSPPRFANEVSARAIEAFGDLALAALAPEADARLDAAIASKLPKATALAIAATSTTSVFASIANFKEAFVLLPWLARAEGEDLYVPREHSRDAPKWSRERSVEMLLIEAKATRPRVESEPVARKTGPSRQGPCPCGSGKKYKRCCGAEAR
jgi:hypothetical protein